MNYLIILILLRRYFILRRILYNQFLNINLKNKILFLCLILVSSLNIKTTRPTVATTNLTNVNFDTFNQLNGWHTDFTNYKWFQTNGNLSNALGMYGPGSDYKSISSDTLNITNLISTRLKCSIPYCDQDLKEQYYCKRLVKGKKDIVCIHNSCPETLSISNYGRCNLGFYMMTKNENYANPTDSFRSRFISPVYRNDRNEPVNYCVSFKYNIYGNDSKDGFKFYLENYLDSNNDIIELWEKKAPLSIDKWYSVSLLMRNLKFKQFRVCFFF